MPFTTLRSWLRALRLPGAAVAAGALLALVLSDSHLSQSPQAGAPNVKCNKLSADLIRCTNTNPMAGDHLELKVKFTDPPGQDVRCHYDVTASNPGDEGPVVDLTFAHQVGVDSCATAANSMMVIDDLKLTLGNTPVPAKIAMVKQPQLSKLVAKPLTGQVFDLPEEPTGYGATARFCEEDDNCPFFSLPSTGWKGLGNPPGDKGYKFKDSICKAIVKPKLVKILCKPSDPSFVLPVTDDVGVELLIGESRYCASSVGGTIVGNPSSVFKVKNAPAPGVCPDLGSPSGAFIEVPRSALF